MDCQWHYEVSNDAPTNTPPAKFFMSCIDRCSKMQPADPAGYLASANPVCWNTRVKQTVKYRQRKDPSQNGNALARTPPIAPIGCGAPAREQCHIEPRLMLAVRGRPG